MLVRVYVNIMTVSEVMIIFVYKGLTRNLEIRNITAWVLPSIWRLARVRDTKFGTNVSNKDLLNSAKCHGYSFFCFLVIKGENDLKHLKVSLTWLFMNLLTRFVDLTILLNSGSSGKIILTLYQKHKKCVSKSTIVFVET